MSLKALIPVRKGSGRVKNKNIRPFAGSSLLEIKVKQLQRVEGIDEVCVNSDCDEMLDLATKLGATAIKRDPHFASSTVPMNEVWENLAGAMDCEDVLYTNVTNPLIKDETYQKILSMWPLVGKGTNKYDSLTTTHDVVEYLWEDGKAVNYDPSFHPRSQDLPRYYGLNFAVSIIPRVAMASRKSIIGDCFFPYKLDMVECLDIDEEEDFQLAEIIYKAIRK